MGPEDPRIPTGLAFISLFVFSTILLVASSTDGCAIKYKKHVDDKPQFFLMSNGLPGLCRIDIHEDNSSVNYHADRKYAEEIRPENIVGGLNYDVRNGSLLYWAKVTNVDHSRLYRVRLNDSEWQPVLEQDDDFRDVAYDWISRNLYIIMGSRSLMIAVSAEQPWNPSVIMYDRSQLTSLAVHPNRGYLFFVERSYWYGVRNNILRANLDGSSIREFNRSGAESRYYISSLAVDYYAERLYWSVPGLDKIQHSNLDGGELRTISGVRVHSGQLDLASRVLALDKHYLYYRSAEANSVQRIDKSTASKDPDFELVNDEAAPMTEILVITHKSQRIRKDHPCKQDRGGCDKYCFAVPTGQADGLKRVCKCSFSEVLAPDGVSCVKKRQPLAGYS